MSLRHGADEGSGVRRLLDGLLTYRGSRSARPKRRSAGAKRAARGRLNRGEGHRGRGDLTRGPLAAAPIGLTGAAWRKPPDRGQAYEPPPPCKVAAPSAHLQVFISTRSSSVALTASAITFRTYLLRISKCFTIAKQQDMTVLSAVSLAPGAT